VRRAGKRPAGFTLIELLVAAALSALAAVVLAGAVAAGLRVWERAGRLGADYAAAVTGLELLRQDIRNAGPHRLQRFEGAATWVEFPAVVTRVEAAGTNAYAGAVRYEFLPARGEVARLERAYALPGGGAERKETLMTGVEEAALAYGDRGEAGVAGMQWVASWVGRTNAPAAVRVRVALRKGEAFDQTVVLPRN
jgi:prepilin-type N-terminal cleavage/methylation domain-containing protein